MEVDCRVEMLLRILYGSIYNSWAPLDGYLQTVKLNSGSILLNKPVTCIYIHSSSNSYRIILYTV